jgi:hypothetical protein
MVHTNRYLRGYRARNCVAFERGRLVGWSQKFCSTGAPLLVDLLDVGQLEPSGRVAVCSNRAATRVNLLKCWEKSQHRNLAICGSFAISSRNLQQTNALPPRGRGRWYETTRTKAPQRRPRPSPTTILAASVSRPPHPPQEKVSGRLRPYHRPLRPASTTRSPHRPFGQASTILSPVVTLPCPTPQA